VEGEVAGAGVEQHAAFAAIVDTRYGAPALDAGATALVHACRRLIDARGRAKRAERPARQRVGNPVVGRTHHAANRLRAVSQRGRPTDHLDLIGCQRVDRHEVVFAQVRGATAADAVVDDADAIDIEAADDRPA